jgi:hypothetical protein
MVIGLMLLLGSGVLMAVSWEHTAAAEQGVSSAAGLSSLRGTLYAAAMLITGGLMMVAGAVLAVVERLP